MPHLTISELTEMVNTLGLPGYVVMALVDLNVVMPYLAVMAVFG